MVYGGAGLRQSEGCALRREDVDPAEYILEVQLRLQGNSGSRLERYFRSK